MRWPSLSRPRHPVSLRVVRGLVAAWALAVGAGLGSAAVTWLLVGVATGPGVWPPAAAAGVGVVLAVALTTALLTRPWSPDGGPSGRAVAELEVLESAVSAVLDRLAAADGVDADAPAGDGEDPTGGDVEPLRLSPPGDGPPEPARAGGADDPAIVVVRRLTAGVSTLVDETARAHEARRAARAEVEGSVVNIARRTLVLLGRQLSIVDTLERSELDPDALDALYRLDHLATRMRRNAESLLVLVDADAARQPREPMSLSDVLRTATSGIEHYQRIELRAAAWETDDPLVVAHRALPAAHLVAELLDNATSFSEPSRPVRVTTSRTVRGIRVTVADEGFGMTDDEIAAAEELIRSSPSQAPVSSARLGFHVVGRLAGRLGATVGISRGPAGGLVVDVDLPADLLVPDPVPAAGPDGVQRPAPPFSPAADPGAGPDGGQDGPADAGPGSAVLGYVPRQDGPDRSRGSGAARSPGGLPVRVRATGPDVVAARGDRDGAQLPARAPLPRRRDLRRAREAAEATQSAAHPEDAVAGPDPDQDPAQLPATGAAGDRPGGAPAAADAESPERPVLLPPAAPVPPPAPTDRAPAAADAPDGAPERSGAAWFATGSRDILPDGRERKPRRSPAGSPWRGAGSRSAPASPHGGRGTPPADAAPAVDGSDPGAGPEPAPPADASRTEVRRRSALASEALSELSMLSSYRPESTEAASSPPLQRRERTDVPPPVPPATTSTAGDRDAGSVRSVIAGFAAGVRRGRAEPDATPTAPPAPTGGWAADSTEEDHA